MSSAHSFSNMRSLQNFLTNTVPQKRNFIFTIPNATVIKIYLIYVLASGLNNTFFFNTQF